MRTFPQSQMKRRREYETWRSRSVAGHPLVFENFQFRCARQSYEDVKASPIRLSGVCVLCAVC